VERNKYSRKLKVVSRKKKQEKKQKQKKIKAENLWFLNVFVFTAH